jgi:hypothetical protein
MEPLPPVSELDIQQLSLQMFMGKTQYQKYLAKSNPQSFRETQRKHTAYIQHETQIRSLMNDLLRAYVHPDTHSMPTHLDSDIVDAFTTFVDKAVFHYEKIRATEEYQLPPDADDEQQNDEDTMFAQVDEPVVNPFSRPHTKPRSVWGKPITKAPITNTLDYYMKPANSK